MRDVNGVPVNDSDSEDEEDDPHPAGESVLSFGGAEPGRALQLAMASLITITAYVQDLDLEVLAQNDPDFRNLAINPFHNALSALAYSWAHASGKPTIPTRKPATSASTSTKGPAQAGTASRRTQSQASGERRAEGSNANQQTTADPFVVPTYAGVARNGRGAHRLSDKV